MLSPTMTILMPSRLRGPIERLVAALADPARGEWTMVVVLCAYAVLWAVYATLSNASQDLHYDMVEMAALAREPALGYFKHPPLAVFLVKAWFAVFPLADWSYYLLATTVPALTLWIVWRLSADFMSGEKRVLGLALLMLVPFFNFHALRFNANTVLLPLWAATTLWFLRSYETRSWLYAALAGIAAAGAMLGKYWSIFLLMGLGLAALLDSRRGIYFRSAAPWITAGVGLLVLAPHLLWLYQNNFGPFSYALGIHGDRTLFAAIKSSLGYLAGGAAYGAVALALVLVIVRPSRAAWRNALFPGTPQRQLAALAFWAPLLLPAIVAPLAGVEVVSLWTISCWSLLPVVLLSSPLVVVTRDAAVRVVAIAAALPVAMVIMAPAIAVAMHQFGLVKPSAAHSRLLARAVEQAWHETTDRPLRLVGGQGDLAYGVAFYAAEKPSALPDFDRKLAFWITPERLVREGIALVCASSDRLCVTNAESLAAAGPPGRRSEVALARRHFGSEGASARYLIITVPPR
jgi:4-amino-4-deoxy-L-arabinose transferase-like glycosyltransferase